MIDVSIYFTDRALHDYIRQVIIYYGFLHFSGAYIQFAHVGIPSNTRSSSARVDFQNSVFTRYIISGTIPAFTFRRIRMKACTQRTKCTGIQKNNLRGLTG